MTLTVTLTLVLGTCVLTGRCYTTKSRVHACEVCWTIKFTVAILMAIFIS